MKKTIILFLFLGSVLTKVSGQFHVGLKAGLNISNVHFNDDFPPNAIRFNCGVLSQIGLGQKLFLQPEVLYSQKGWGSFVNQYGPANATALEYLTIPVMLAYKASSKLSLLIGPEAGYLWRQPHKDLYDKFDLGASAGASYLFTKNLGVEMRYTYGLIPLSKAYGRDSNNQPTGEVYRNGYNRVFQINAYFLFGR